MQLEITRVKISLRQLKWQEKKFCISYFADLSQLKQSISAVGILNPPIVQSVSAEGFQIVSGWRRLTALKELGREFCEVCVLKKKQSDLQLFEMALYENLSVRGFNVMEKAFIIKKLLTEFKITEKKIVEIYLPVLKLGRNRKWLNWSQKLVNFPQQVQQAFAKDVLSFDLIDFLEKINSQDQEQFVNLVTTLCLSKNRQKELTMLAADLARLKNVSFAELFKVEEVVKIIENKKLTHSQKTAKLFEWLKIQRFPAYSKVEKDFLQLVRSLKIPANIQIRHSPYFESDWFSLQFSFRNLEEFQKAVEFQNCIKNEEQIGKLVNLTDRNKEIV